MDQVSFQWLSEALDERLVNGTGPTGESDPEATRMTINQITFAILISVLLVANTYLVWCLAYIVIAHEKIGRYTVRLLYSGHQYSTKPSSTTSTQESSAIS